MSHRLRRSLIVCAALFCPLPSAARAAQSGEPHPDTPEAFAAAVGLEEVHLVTGDQLEIWCAEPSQAKLLKEPALNGWNHATELLRGLYMPEELVTRVIVLPGHEALLRYAPLVEAEAKRLYSIAPSPAHLDSLKASGSFLWSYPPVLFINGKLLRKDELMTRVVHDLGAIRARFAMSPNGGDPPEFFLEGFAGMIVRNTIKKPTGLVNHEDAALESTIHGYGVFAGISGLNDASNHPGNWPSVIKTAVKRMRKAKEPDRASFADALLVRPKDGFARADYAYAWSVVEFLFDDRMPFGPAAVEAAGDRKWKVPKEPAEFNRRQGVLAGLEELRKPAHASLDAVGRGEALRKAVLAYYDESPEQFQEAFMHWVEKVMPKR